MHNNKIDNLIRWPISSVLYPCFNRGWNTCLTVDQQLLGECQDQRGQKVCFQPEAIYLNGNGQALSEDDGSGAWRVKHSWILGGEGYENSELKPMADYTSFYVEGKLLSDGITIKIGATEFGHNFRWPVYGEKDKDVSYRVQRYDAVEQDDGSFEYVAGFNLFWECENKASAFDGLKRGCPKAND